MRDGDENEGGRRSRGTPRVFAMAPQESLEAQIMAEPALRIRFGDLVLDRDDDIFDEEETPGHGRREGIAHDMNVAPARALAGHLRAALTCRLRGDECTQCVHFMRWALELTHG